MVTKGNLFNQIVMPKKFVTICKDEHVPYPEGLTRREKVHLEACPPCQGFWFELYVQRCVMGCETDLNVVLTEFAELPEADRQRLHLHFQQRELKWLQSMRRKKAPNPYNLYFQQLRKKDPVIRDMSFGAATKLTAKTWKAMSKDLKQTYVNMSNSLQQALALKISKLPKYLKLKMRNLGKKRKSGEAWQHVLPKPPLSAYFNFQKRRWDETKQQAQASGAPKPQYNEARRTIKAEWDNMPPSAKRRYTEEARHARAEYDRKKNALLDMYQQSQESDDTFYAETKSPQHDDGFDEVHLEGSEVEESTYASSSVGPE